jgi:hypothetical protein
MAQNLGLSFQNEAATDGLPRQPEAHRKLTRNRLLYYCDLHNNRPKRLKLRLSGSARKSQKRFRDTPTFKFRAVLARTQPFLSHSVKNGATNPDSNAEKWPIIVQFAVSLVSCTHRLAPRSPPTSPARWLAQHLQLALASPRGHPQAQAAPA